VQTMPEVSILIGRLEDKRRLGGEGE